MSRMKGHDSGAVRDREASENSRFAQRRVLDDLELAELKVSQAMKRPSKELLQSAVELIQSAREIIVRAS